MKKFTYAILIMMAIEPFVCHASNISSEVTTKDKEKTKEIDIDKVIKKCIEITSLSLKNSQDMLELMEQLIVFFLIKTRDINDPDEIKEIASFVFSSLAAEASGLNHAIDFIINTKYMKNTKKTVISNYGSKNDKIDTIKKDIKNFHIKAKNMLLTRIASFKATLESLEVIGMQADHEQLQYFFGRVSTMHTNAVSEGLKYILKGINSNLATSFNQEEAKKYEGYSDYFDIFASIDAYTSAIATLKYLYSAGLKCDDKLLKMPITKGIIIDGKAMPKDLSELFIFDGPFANNSEASEKEITEWANKLYLKRKEMVKSHIKLLEKTKTRRDSLFKEIDVYIQSCNQKNHEEKLKLRLLEEKKLLKKSKNNGVQKPVLKTIKIIEEEIIVSNTNETIKETVNIEINNPLKIENTETIEKEKKLPLKERKETINIKNALDNAEKFKSVSIPDNKEKAGALSVKEKSQLLSMLVYKLKSSDLKLMINILNETRGIQTINNEKVLTLLKKLGVEETSSRHGDYRKLRTKISKDVLNELVKDEKRLNATGLTLEEANAFINRIEGNNVEVTAMSFRPPTSNIGHNLANIYRNLLNNMGVSEKSLVSE